MFTHWVTRVLSEREFCSEKKKVIPTEFDLEKLTSLGDVISGRQHSIAYSGSFKNFFSGILSLKIKTTINNFYIPSYRFLYSLQ